MKMYIDKETGYLIMEDISEGIEIISTKEYQSYLKQIKDLEEQNKDLQSRINDMASKLADTLSAQAEADKQREKNAAKFCDFMRITAESERNIGIAIGIFATKLGCSYKLAYSYWKAFDDWACKTGVSDAIIEGKEPKIVIKDVEDDSV